MAKNPLPPREVKKLYFKDEARNKVLAGVDKMYQAVNSTYGPAGNNVILGMPYGDATLTRDGVTVAKRVILEDKAEDDAAGILRQASENTNKTAGDGTTATIGLARHLFKGGYGQMRGSFGAKFAAKVVVKLAVLFRSRYLAALSTRLSAKFNGMLIKKQITEDSRVVVEFLKSRSMDAKDRLQDVATVAAGDPAIGALVADTLKDIGDGGGITVREQTYPTLDVEKVNGYYFDKGFFALNQSVEYAKPVIFVTQKSLSANSDIVPLLARIINGDNKNLVIVGDVRMNTDAMNTLLLNCMQSKLNAVVIPPPAFADDNILFMQDIALYVGARLFTKADDMSQLKDTDEFFGTAERVQCSQDKAIIFRGNGVPEDIATRAAEIKQRIDQETNENKKDHLEKRFARLTGKVAIVNVGGNTQVEMEELRYRVEDAIEATKSAMADGVLPGGGSMLVKAADLDISPLFKQALLDTFRKLMENAAEPADYRLKQMQLADEGYGFNLREMTEEPVDLREAGIFDATRAVVQTVENATSAAASLLTAGTIVDPVEREESDE